MKGRYSVHTARDPPKAGIFQRDLRFSTPTSFPHPILKKFKHIQVLSIAEQYVAHTPKKCCLHLHENPHRKSQT